MAGSGRKNKYETHVKPYLKEIEEWCQTMTEEQICKRLGIGTSSWAVYKQKHAELSETIKRGRRDLVTDLRSALIRKAKGFEYTESKVTSEKVQMPKEMKEVLLDAGFDVKELEKAKIVKTEVAKKKAHPDVAALNLALKNYDKENWANDPQMIDLRKKELELRERQVEANEW